jgi:SAM-dependent methyltransferase
MSKMAQDGKDRFFAMADTYHEMVPYMLPRYDFLQEELIQLLPLAESPRPAIVDLGGGSGILLGKILQVQPKATCYWVDYSPDFLRIAQQTLADYGDRVKYILTSFEDAWEDEVPESPDAIVSMSAIHHLETAEKQDLYQRCYDKLRPGGWFFNADEMKTIYPDAYLNSMQFWLNYVNGSAPTVPTTKRAYYDKWFAHFENWRARNIEHFSEPKSKGDDIHESFLEQLQWLKEIGFTGVDVFVKYHLWSIIGGRKPDSNSDSLE